MAVEGLAGGASWGVAFLVSAGIVAEIIAKACSSPQTLEINVGKRGDTLWKWVMVGTAEAAAFVAVAAWVDKRHRMPILLGGGAEIIITWAEYAHGKRSGLANGGPSTESY